MRLKKRTFSGVVLEQEVYTLPDRCQVGGDLNKKLRFESEEARKQHRDGIARRRYLKIFNATFSPSSLYSTLTFDNVNEVHTFKEARQLRDNFYNRLKYKYPDAVIVLHMGRGKHTKRIHMHMVSEGVPAEDIKKQWIYGEIVDIQPLRAHNFYDGVDHGADYTGLANYLFDHWTEEQGGHRYKISRNYTRPEEEPPKEVKRDYSLTKAPQAPAGYELVEATATIYGYLYFKYIKIPEDRKEPPKRRRKEQAASASL